ncbi:MAG: hypothetical protein DIU60_017585 [Actinomycetes bacterium]|jgi:hypothetical protein|nr:MAG: hypothetical protein DIU60_05380 [Actinomycetota bacterium]
MTVIGIVLGGLAVATVVLLVLADPVLLSRINGEHAEGDSGRHLSTHPAARRRTASPFPAHVPAPRPPHPSETRRTAGV